MTRLIRLLGIEVDTVSRRERLVSLVGGFVGVLALVAVSQGLLGLSAAQALTGSMAASAVLIFCVPRSAFSQPWPVFGGHVCGAVIGVACVDLIGTKGVAGAIAVGLTIVAMYALRCIHPPGGATAFVAVIGGNAVTSLGYSFIWRPVIVDVVTLLAVGVLFNNLFPWRRYPAGIGAGRSTLPTDPGSHERVLAALREMDSFVDVTEADLVRLAALLNRGPEGSSR